MKKILQSSGLHNHYVPQGDGFSFNGVMLNQELQLTGESTLREVTQWYVHSKIIASFGGCTIPYLQLHLRTRKFVTNIVYNILYVFT